MSVEEYRMKLMDIFHNAGRDEFIALLVEPNETDFRNLESLLKEEI